MTGDLFVLGFFLIGYGGPVAVLVMLARASLVTPVGAALGGAAMVVVSVWSWHDITTSTSSTAALGFLVVPPLLFLIAGATYVLDRAVVLGRRRLGR